MTTTLPAAFTLVTPPPTPGAMQTPGRSVSFLVEPKADAAPGVYPVRIETPSGIVEHPAVHAGHISRR